MKRFGTYFSYCMGIGLIAPIIGGLPVGNYTRFLLIIAGGSALLSIIFVILDKQTDKLIKSLLGRKTNRS